MQAEKMKNIIVLKNLPSNIVDEALVILKDNKRAKVLNKIDSKEEPSQIKEKSEDYILKEAEMVISNYLSKLDSDKQIKSYSMRKLEHKCKRLKWLSLLLGITTLLFIFI